MEQFLGASSTGGAGFQKTLVAGVAAQLHTDMPCTSCMIWTPDADVYLNLGAVASATSFLLIANAYLPVPMGNLNQILAMSLGGGTVHVLYRTK